MNVWKFVAIGFTSAKDIIDKKIEILKKQYPSGSFSYLTISSENKDGEFKI